MKCLHKPDSSKLRTDTMKNEGKNEDWAIRGLKRKKRKTKHVVSIKGPQATSSSLLGCQGVDKEDERD